MELDERIGSKLRDLRNQKKLTTRQVADKTGVSNAYISQIEHGKIPSLSVLQKLCELYDIKIQSLFGEEVEVPEELKELDVGWITFAKEMDKQELTPEEVKKYIEAVKTLKGLM